MSFIKTKFDRNYFENLLYRENSHSQRNKKRLQEILKCKKNGELLEVGCAKGEFLKLAKDYFDVEGIDISEYAIAQAKKVFGDKVKVGNVINAKLKQNYYDVIVLFNLLEHIPCPDELIGAIHGSLKSKGILIGSVPNNSKWVGWFFTRLTNFLDKTHCFTYSPSRWVSVFERGGFSKITLFGEILLSRNRCVYLKKSYWKYISFNLMFLCQKEGYSLR